MRKFFFGAVAAIACTPACAQRPYRPQRPKSAKADHRHFDRPVFRADLFDEYRPVSSAGSGGCREARCSATATNGTMRTETCPGHSTIMTGARPSRTGIIANYWFDQSQSRSDKGVYCSEDERVQGSSSLAYTVSPIICAYRRWANF